MVTFTVAVMASIALYVEDKDGLWLNRRWRKRENAFDKEGLAILLGYFRSTMKCLSTVGSSDSMVAFLHSQRVVESSEMGKGREMRRR